jgi:stage II sporulation protein D
LSTTIQLTANFRKIALWIVFLGRRFGISSEKTAILLLMLLTLSGCKNRQFTTPTPQMDIESQFWIRILLLDDVKTCSLKIASPFSVFNEKTDLQTQTIKARFGQIDKPISIQLTDSRITIAGRTFLDNEVIILPDDPYIFSLNGSDYRGKLKLIINPDGTSFDAINLVPPEPYLAGVVGAEMPPYWESEALKAQTIAARTYCFYIKKRFGTNRAWDMKKTAAHQVYRGLSAESAQIWNAVNQTNGQVLTCEQTDSTEEIFPAYYSSTCGGHTENSKNVFGDFFEPQYPKLKQLGKIINISPADQSNYGEFSRLTKVKLLGSTNKSDFLKAEDFRLTIDPTGRKFKSTICQIVKWGDKWVFSSGRGWGHGVGMCQCGAEGMARNGKNAKQILSYYYPDSKILTIDY